MIISQYQLTSLRIFGSSFLRYSSGRFCHPRILNGRSNLLDNIKSTNEKQRSLTYSVIVWRRHSSFPLTLRTSFLAAVTVIFIGLALDCLFLTDWSPDSSILDALVGGLFSYRTTQEDWQEASVNEAPDDPITEYRRTRGRFWFSRFATAQLIVASIYLGIAAGSAWVFTRISTSFCRQLSIRFHLDRPTHWIIACHGHLLFPVSHMVPFSDLRPLSLVFDKNLDDFVQRVFSGQDILFLRKFSKYPLAISLPLKSSIPLVGEIWDPLTLWKVFHKKI